MLSKGGRPVPEKLAQCIIVCGHYGAGKTNLTVNLALLAAGAGERVTVVDMDIVNPYFRTADHQELFLDAGIRLIAPVYANTNLDLPVLPPSVTTAIRSGERVFLDVGGDDDGAVVLGGFSSVLGEQGYSMLYVVNRCRELEPDPVQEAQLLERVSRASRLRPTHLVDNTNLMGETTPQLLERSEEYIREVSRLTRVPVLCQAVERRLAGQLPAKGKLPVTIYVKPPWEER